ncbi:MAG TPA: UdgX family uracil-DNA binding protein, partial [Acidimicrobiales bacterium]|nr:UdgX family uracil-DNA binding protein [Acidimicrobiales bacterium]
AVARGCTACDLYRCGTQTVFGEGEPGARLMLVGEQPGDKEDLAGEPFVGPAGSLLDKALAAAGIERGDAYVTNAVKHFKWKPDPRGGKRRIHAKPNAKEVAACRPWLDAELDRVRPETVVLLGATAAQALLGRQFKVTEQRGRPIAWEGHTVVATVHPSSILRAPDAEARRVQFDGLVADLRVAARRATGRATVRA